MPLYLFYSVVQKSQKWPKTQIKGGGSCLKFPSALWPKWGSIGGYGILIFLILSAGIFQEWQMQGGGTQNAGRRLLEGISSTADTVRDVSAGPALAFTSWFTDQIAPPYWVPNSEIVVCVINVSFHVLYCRKRESASYIVREWLLWVVERERERERERDACDINRYHAEIASDHAYDYLDGETLCLWLCRRVLSLSSARVHVKTRSLALERSSSRVEWLMNHDGEVEALHSLVSLSWITQQHFVGMLQARRIDQADVCFLFEWQRFCLWEQLANGNGSAFENNLDSGRISFRKRPCAIYKDNTVGNVVVGTGRDLVFGTTARLSDLSMPLTGEVRRSPEPSAKPSAGANSEERQICTACLFAERVGLCLCFLQSCAMYKDNAVGNVVAETGRDLVFMTTARLSDLSMPLKGQVRRSPEQSARQPIARSGKFYDVLIRGERWIAKTSRQRSMLSPIVEHTSVWEGVGGRGEISRGSPQWNTKDKLPKPQTATVATAQRPKQSSTY